MTRGPTTAATLVITTTVVDHVEEEEGGKTIVEEGGMIGTGTMTEVTVVATATVVTVGTGMKRGGIKQRTLCPLPVSTGARVGMHARLTFSLNFKISVDC